jgi:hypothetical protein
LQPRYTEEEVEAIVLLFHDVLTRRKQLGDDDDEEEVEVEVEVEENRSFYIFNSI